MLSFRRDGACVDDSLALAAQTIELDFSKSPSSRAPDGELRPANGTAFGTLAGVNIDEEGYVTAVYENGTPPHGAVAIANFPNPDGLESVKGNAYRPSVHSGGVTLKGAGTAGAAAVALQPRGLNGTCRPSFRLITTQTAYSASSKILTMLTR